MIGKSCRAAADDTAVPLTMYLHRSTFPIEFEWDAEKAATNVAKHGIDFRAVVHTWRDPLALVLAVNYESGVRYRLIGAMDDRIVTIVFTIRMQAIRLISARHASRQERRRYAQTPRDA